MSDIIECIDGLTANQIIRRAAKTANGLPFYLQTKGAGGLDLSPEYQAVYDYWEANLTVPDDAIALNQDVMVRAMVAGGSWAIRDVIYLWSGHSQLASLTNWKNPGTTDAIVVPNGGAIAFTAFEGFTSDGNAYINTNYNPATFGGNYAQNDANMSIYIRTDVSEMAYDFGGNDAVNGARLAARWTDNKCYNIFNTSSSSPYNVVDSLGYYSLNRVLASHQDGYKNKVLGVHGARVSGGVPNVDFYACGRNNNGALDDSGKQQSFAGVGGGMTKPQIDAETDAVEAYMDSNGKGVVP